jgi:hypothetical protein
MAHVNSVHGMRLAGVNVNISKKAKDIFNESIGVSKKVQQEKEKKIISGSSNDNVEKEEKRLKRAKRKK